MQVQIITSIHRMFHDLNLNLAHEIHGKQVQKSKMQ